MQVAALVGDALDPTAGVETDGHRTFTLWGEMAAQIGDSAFEAMAANDCSAHGPGHGHHQGRVRWEADHRHRRRDRQVPPAVSSSGSEDVRRMARAIPVFLGNLFEVASDPTNNVSVIITLAATTNAFGAETTEISELTGDEKEKADAANAASVKATEETGDVLTRAVQPSAVIKPADDNEIGEILKKRIFASVDAAAAKAAGEAYRACTRRSARPSSWPVARSSPPPTANWSPRRTRSIPNWSASWTSGWATSRSSSGPAARSNCSPRSSRTSTATAMTPPSSTSATSTTPTSRCSTT